MCSTSLLVGAAGSQAAGSQRVRLSLDLERVAESRYSPSSLPAKKKNRASVSYKNVAGNLGGSDAAYIFKAIVSGSNEVTKRLLTLFPDLLDSQDDQGRTILLYASFLNKTDVIDILLAAGANVLVFDAYQRSSLHYAAMNGNVVTLCKLIAALREKLTMSEFYAFCNYGDHKKETALHKACLNGYLEVVKVLLKYSPSLERRNSMGMTALACAALKGHCDIVERLLLAGADVNTNKDIELNTPLHYAAFNNDLPMVKLLVQNYAMTWYENKTGKIPWSLATSYQVQDFLEKVR